MADGAVNRQAVVVASVQALDVGRKLLAQPAQLKGFGTPTGRIQLAAGVPRLAQLVEYIELAAFVGVQL